ncbi:MAG: TolC family protein [Petrimonas sp.]|nr:TolC family protein [Petrimonas sp.]
MKRFFFLFFPVFLLVPNIGFAQKTVTLDDYLATAKENSPVLSDYNNQRYSLKIDSLKMLADYGVKVTANGDAMYAPVIKGWGYDNALSNGQNVTAVIRITRDLLGKANKDTRLADYNLASKQMINQIKITELQLNRAVTEQYLNTYTAQQLYQNYQEIIKLLNEEDVILKKLTQESAFKQTDYLSFKVTLQQNLLAMQQQRADWLNNYATLNYLAGVVDTTLSVLQPPLMPDKMPLPFEQSIYAESYITDSLKLANDAKIINYDYRPKLSAYADGGYSSSFITTPYKNFGASVGLSLTVPIYDGNKRKMMLQQNRLAQATRKRYNEFEHNRYLQQTAQLQAQIRQYEQMQATAGEQLVYSQALIEANLKQLPTGDVKIADFILSINNYLNLKSSLVQYQDNLYKLYNNLNYLTIQ